MLIIAASASAQSSTAQSPAPPTAQVSASRAIFYAEGTAAKAKEEVTVALFESFSAPGISAVIRRTKGNSGKVLIAVKRSQLSAELLGSLFSSVPSTAGAKRPMTDRVDMYFRTGRSLPPVRATDRAIVEKALRELLAAIPTTVQGFGKLPSITLHL